MYTEKFADLRLGWVAAGWLVAIAVSSLIGLVVAAIGLATGAEGEVGFLGSNLIAAAGFSAGGYFTGFRALRSPVLHGVAIGLASLVVWLVLNLLVVPFTPLGWEALTPWYSVVLLTVQMASAVAGAWVGHWVALTGGTGMNA